METVPVSSHLEFGMMEKVQNPSDPEVMLQFQERAYVCGSESGLYLALRDLGIA
jgi:hypothetical protein